MASPEQIIVPGTYIESLHGQKYKYPEVLFPNKFTDQHPWQQDPEFIAGHQEAVIPIYHLSHVTHNKEAEKIRENNTFTFCPQMKVGKAYEWDGSPKGETYIEIEENGYMQLPRSWENPVFPGYLSWWGIDVSKWYTTDEGEVLLGRVQTDRSGGKYAPGYLAETTGSSYGNNSFSMELKDILDDYQTSRSDKPGSDLCLKVGGTLRYRHEICYVVIVCTAADDVGSMPNINDCIPPFNPNGMISNGVVFDYSATPTFTVQSTVKTERSRAPLQGYTAYSWENLAFGFYFPKPDQVLRCNNVQVTNIGHPWCISTKPPPTGHGGKWVCPNYL